MQYKLLYWKGKRPDNSREQLKLELFDYIKREFEKRHILSRREIENRFHLKLYSVSKDIDTFYNEMGLKYELSPNQDLKSIKANLLLKITLKNLDKFGLKLICYRKVRDKGIDILCKKQDKKVGIEIKAYNKYERIKKKDIKQILRFIEKENLDKVILITTTDLEEKNINLYSNIIIIKYNALIGILKSKNHKELEYIRDASINIKNQNKEIKRQKILNYVSKKYLEESRKVGYQNILKELHLDIYTYFKDLFEIYKILKIAPPLKNMKGLHSKEQDKESINLWKDEFKKYILEKVEKEKRYPSGEEIGKYFGISHIWNIVKMSELYKELNLKPYLERKRKVTYVQE